VVFADWAARLPGLHASRDSLPENGTNRLRIGVRTFGSESPVTSRFELSGTHPNRLTDNAKHAPTPTPNPPIHHPSTPKPPKQRGSRRSRSTKMLSFQPGSRPAAVLKPRVSEHPRMLLYRVKGLLASDVLRRGFGTAAG
jgi:hypothetical protein